MELIHGGDVGGKDRYDLPALDAEIGDGRSELETSTVGVGPRVSGVAVDDGRAVAVDG